MTLTLGAGFASTIFMPIEAWLPTRVSWRAALTILAVVLAVITFRSTRSCDAAPHDAGVVARCLVRHGFAFNYAWGDQNFAPADTEDYDAEKASASPR